MRPWIRIPVTVFGAVGTLGAIYDGLMRNDLPFLVDGGLVSATLFLFGLYGGLPLVETVKDRVSPTTDEEVTEKHLAGLRVMRIRGCLMLGFLFLGLPFWVLLDTVLQRLALPDLDLAIMSIMVALIFGRYLLSRCPRCGYGFFALSRRRAAGILWTDPCSHCGISHLNFKCETKK